MVESKHIMLFSPPTTITNLIDDGGSTWTIAKNTKRFSLSLSLSLSTCGSETPCLARLNDWLTPNSIIQWDFLSHTIACKSSRGPHILSFLHFFFGSFFQNPNVFFFWLAMTICFLKFPIVFKSAPLLCGYQIFIFIYHSTIGWLRTN